MNDFQITRRTLLGAASGGLYALFSGHARADSPQNGVLGRSQLRLGSRLVGRLADADGTVMVSPASLAAVLAMLAAGGGAPLGKAIHQVLGFDASAKQEQDMAALRSAVGQIPGRFGGEGPLVLANMIVLDPAVKPAADAAARLSVVGAEVSVEDLRHAETIQRINQWVAGRTRNVIPSILDQALDQPGLVALSALHFRDKWRVPFDPTHTRAEKFHLLSGRTVDAAMMYVPDGSYRFRQNREFIAAELAYANDDFRLVVVTSKAEPVRAGEFASLGAWLGGEGFAESAGIVAMPRVRLSVHVDLLKSLDAMGLAPARLRRDAFSALTKAPMVLSHVVQKAELRIDEEGTEAAAATAATASRGALTGSYTKMIVDKPFVFALRDRRTGLVLLCGYVATV